MTHTYIFQDTFDYVTRSLQAIGEFGITSVPKIESEVKLNKHISTDYRHYDDNCDGDQSVKTESTVCTAQFVGSSSCSLLELSDGPSSLLSRFAFREQKANDTYYEKLQLIFCFLQRVGISEDSIWELKESLFSPGTTTEVLERSQEYISLVGNTSETLELLEHAWLSLVCLQALVHDRLYRTMTAHKLMVATDGQIIQHVQEEVCEAAERATASQVGLYKIQRQRQRIERLKQFQRRRILLP